jgi:hypothetical protein
MVLVSVSELQRKMNDVVMPNILAGETVQVIDKKTGEAKFNIVPPTSDTKIEWPDLEERAIRLSGNEEDAADRALEAVRGDRDFSAVL